MSPSGVTGNGDAEDPQSPSSELTAAQIIDLERSQIGHDVHDLLIPLMFAASANLQAALRSADGPAGELAPLLDRIAKSDEWLQQALSLARNLLTQIYPPELDQLSWLAAAKDTANRIGGSDCQVDWDVDPASPVCDSNWNRDQATTAYRVLIEALRNATRHGNAKTISIHCQPDRLVIVDDGTGFDPAAIDPNRFGIRSMKGRARLVGKTVSVESAPGGPTTVTMTL
ncbi:histidine kinase [Stieleria sp. ICT_E10.1]|uniref:sensor histidine kinase n=1 Tax=Stieleria sedimenti TaxID=2976331 RepID=UPI00217F5CF4|nr:ATP-binding protein [Stieleria sedimenti]MCS7467514.1 histidine kinase [Stieleria sedimenti]